MDSQVKRSCEAERAPLFIWSQQHFLYDPNNDICTCNLCGTNQWGMVNYLWTSNHNTFVSVTQIKPNMASHNMTVFITCLFSFRIIQIQNILLLSSQKFNEEILKLHLFHPTLHNGCNYLFILRLKLIHVSKRGWGLFQYNRCSFPVQKFRL